MKISIVVLAILLLGMLLPASAYAADEAVDEEVIRSEEGQDNRKGEDTRKEKEAEKEAPVDDEPDCD